MCIYIYIHTLAYIYTHAHFPKNTQHPKPFNPLLTRFLLTKHVEEFFPLSHRMCSGSQELDDSRAGWPGS